MIRVLVAEDATDVRETIVALLGLEDDIDVVAAVSTGDAIVPAALTYRPDVALLDINLPRLDGITAAARLHRQIPSCRTIILTAFGTPEHRRRAARIGVRAFLHKDAPAGTLIDAVRVAAGWP